MKLVDAIEAEIGPVETWPTSILVILFTFDPTKSIAVYQLTRLIAFCLGNNIPLSLASQFCAASGLFPLCDPYSQSYMADGPNTPKAQFFVLRIV
jgi:hypothetical protein